MKKKRPPPRPEKNDWYGDLTTTATLWLIAAIICALAAWTAHGRVTRGVVLHKSKPYLLATDPASFWIFNLPLLLVGAAAALALILLTRLLIRDLRCKKT